MSTKSLKILGMLSMLKIGLFAIFYKKCHFSAFFFLTEYTKKKKFGNNETIVAVNISVFHPIIRMWQTDSSCLKFSVNDLRFYLGIL